MIKSTIFCSGLIGLLSLCGLNSAEAQIAYALTNGGTTLVSFNLSSPGTISTVGTISGATGTLTGIDFRTTNGLLYGYSNTNTLVTVSLIDGSTTAAGTVPTPVSSSLNLGIDFNPVPSALRVVNDDNQNLRLVLGAGNSITNNNDGPLAYAVGDLFAGTDPTITEAAYTNNDNNMATGTTLYYIDSALDYLVTTAAPNAGTLNTVGPLGFLADNDTGFDIYTDGAGVNSAFATGPLGLYSVNLGSGTSTLVGAFPVFLPGSGISGLAIQPIPEAGSTVLIAAAAIFGMARRRRA